MYGLGPEALPLSEVGNWQESLHGEVFASELAGLGYPGFAYMRTNAAWNPSEFLLRALAQDHLEARVVEALPWVAGNFELNWNWLLPRLKLLDLQNRFGFLLSLCRRLAESKRDAEKAHTFAALEERLQASKLQKLDSFCQQGMTQAERKWLQSNSTPDAKNWGLLSDLEVSHVVHF